MGMGSLGTYFRTFFRRNWLIMFMQIKNAKYLLLLIGIYSANLHAWGWGKHDVYECPEIGVSTCGSSCQKTEFQIEFKVDVSKNLVMLHTYEGKKSLGSSIYDDCKIIDNKNWSCERSSVLNMTFLSMRNGLFEKRSYDLRKTGRPVAGDHFACAKR